MTAVLGPQGSVIELSAEDIRQSIANALRRVGCTFDELAAQARTGEFESTIARRAWVAIGGFYNTPVAKI